MLFLYKSDDAKGIPEFWLTAMKNVDMLADMIQVCVVLVVQPLFPSVISILFPPFSIITLASRWLIRISKLINWGMLSFTKFSDSDEYY